MAAPTRNVRDSSLDKNVKYDRQLRLWGDHGQAALQAAKICLVNATAVGTETLKNCILPGVGSFTVIDHHKVTGQDVGNSFFLDPESIGKNRGQAATNFLLELNEDVSGDSIDQSVEEIISSEQTRDIFSSFTVVIVTDLAEKTLLRLSSVLWDRNVALVVCRSYGFMGYLRLQVKEHVVFESHPDNTHPDLRLDKPFPGLQEYCDSLDMSSMTKKDHGHTPWLVVVYKCLQEWTTQHVRHPETYKEKLAFKEFIKSRVLLNVDGVPELEENFDEAIQNVNTVLVPTKSSNFWIMARAVKDFIENEGDGFLPLRGSIPDMTSDSERYISLQQVYKDQANQDADVVLNRVHTLLQSTGRGEPLGGATRHDNTPMRSKCSDRKPFLVSDVITELDVRSFCKNAAFLQVIRCHSLQDEYNHRTANTSELGMYLEDTENNDFVMYVLLRAVDRFHGEYDRYPGNHDNDVEMDIPKLKTHVMQLLQEWGLPLLVKDDFIHEMCRYGGAELHSVSSFIGGIAAQEVIKVITRQFVPVNNTYIYNAMKQTSMTVKL